MKDDRMIITIKKPYFDINHFMDLPDLNQQGYEHCDLQVSL